MNRNGYDEIEGFFKSKSTKKIRLVGILLTITGLLCFLFGTAEIQKNTFITNIYLIYRYNLIFGWGVILCHILACIVLFMNSLIDKFRWACLFVIVNVPCFFLFGIWELHKHFPSVQDTASLTVIDFFVSLILMLMFGLESQKSVPQNSFFKILRVYGAKIQADFDKRQKALEEKSGRNN